MDGGHRCVEQRCCVTQSSTAVASVDHEIIVRASLIGTVIGTTTGPLYAIYLNTLGFGKLRFRSTVAATVLLLAVLRAGG